MKKTELVALLENIKACGEVNFLSYGALCQAIEDLNAEIRQENNRLSGSSNIAAAAASILKSGKASGNRALSGSWTVDGKQYVCDGHRIMEILQPIELEPLPDDVKPFDVKKIFTDLGKNPEAFQLPTYGELKSMLQKARAAWRLENGRRKVRFLFQIENGPALNAEYLLDALRATGADTLRTVKSNKGTFICPCYLESDAARVLLLPVNVQAGKAAGIHSIAA